MLRYQKGYIFNGYTFVVNKEDVHNAKDDMFVEATALLPDGWISVKERLPCDSDTSERTGYGCVLAYGPRSGVDAVSIYWLLEFENDVTHWMPLPEPPKEDVDES